MTGPRRFRLLSDDEIELWRVVAQTITPRHGSKLPQIVRPDPPADVAQASPVAPKAKPQPKSVVASYSPPQSRPRSSLPPLAPLERPYRRKVVRGHIGIERVLDLHGLNQADAHNALRSFLRQAQADDLRLVLLVTGKGRRAASSADATDIGILRRAVPHWLREGDLRNAVLGFEEAGLTHGGAGALYIRLRQRHS